MAEVRTTLATAHKRRRRLSILPAWELCGRARDASRSLPACGPALAPGSVEPCGPARSLAAFCAAWDRLDYNGALKVDLAVPGEAPSRWVNLVPPQAIRDWVKALSEPMPESNRDRAAKLRLLVADLLANGERRLRDHQYEDAVIRAYRILELIGQIRLFARDLDSEALPADHPDVKSFQDKLRADNGSETLTERNGTYTAGQNKVARLLKYLGDPLGKPLLQLADRSEGNLKLSRRNYSIWIHGFEAIGGSEPGPIKNLYKELERLLVLDGGPAAELSLRHARWLDLASHTQ